MQIQYNRRLAIAVLIVCILASIFGLGGMGLARSRNAALRVFDEGVDTSFAVRFSIGAYLENCAGYARTMAEEFRMRVNSESETAKTALDLSEKAGDGDHLDARKEAYAALNSAVEALYSEFHASIADKNAQADFDRAYANYQSETNKIRYDEYNAMARDHNALCTEVPARWIAGIYGIGSLETFG